MSQHVHVTGQPLVVNGYKVWSEYEAFPIFPVNRKGESCRVMIIRSHLHLQHESSEKPIFFKRYKHQGRWGWRDSRYEKPVQEHHVLAEVARMLFKGDQNKAATVLMHVVMNLPLAAAVAVEDRAEAVAV